MPFWLLCAGIALEQGVVVALAYWLGFRDAKARYEMVVQLAKKVIDGDPRRGSEGLAETPEGHQDG